MNVIKTNSEIAHNLRKLAFLLEMDVDDYVDQSIINFKNRAYKRAADQIEGMSINVESIYENEGVNGLLKIPSVGIAISSLIEQFFKTGEIQILNDLLTKFPLQVEDFMKVEGLGPKTLSILYKNLKIKNLEDLENAAHNKKIQGIKGFSNKKEEDIMKKIEIYKTSKGRLLIGEIYPFIKQIVEYLSTQDPSLKILPVGSVRRMKETIGDIDFIATAEDSEKVIELFVNMPYVNKVLSKGSNKGFVKMHFGLDTDLLVVPSNSYGAALIYFTGSKEHNIALRKIARRKKFRLNEWGLFNIDTNEKVAGSTELEVYNKLGLEWIPPEMRENTGEIELAMNSDKNKNVFSNLINYGDLKGDLQVHSSYTDGEMSIEEMVFFAKNIFNLEYISISDHTQSLKIARGLDEEQLLNQANNIGELNDRIKNEELVIDSRKVSSICAMIQATSIPTFDSEFNNIKKDFKVFTSAEVNILKDGSLDISSNVLDKLDIVGAAIHSNFNLPIEIQTERLVRAAQNPSVDIIFHPTGRIINKRLGYPLDIQRLLEAARDYNTVLEIDSHFNRLDLKDEYIKKSVENNNKLVIDSDSHHPLHFTFLNFGIGQARRGWAKRNFILNTLTSDELLRNLK